MEILTDEQIDRGICEMLGWEVFDDFADSREAHDTEDTFIQANFTESLDLCLSIAEKNNMQYTSMKRAEGNEDYWHVSVFDREHGSMGTTARGLARACAFLLHGMLEYRDIVFKAALTENE